MIHQDAPDKYHVVEKVKTMFGGRNMALDPTNHRVFVIAREFVGEAPGGRGRNPIQPGMFRLLVIERVPPAR